MSTIITLEMPASAADKLRDPQSKAKFIEYMKAQGFDLDGVEFPEPPRPTHLPCPRCGSTEIKFGNCGYSSFDVAHALCKCGHRLSVPGSDARSIWNAFGDDDKQRLFCHYLNSTHKGSDGDARKINSREELVRVAAIIFQGSHTEDGHARGIIPW